MLKKFGLSMVLMAGMLSLAEAQTVLVEKVTKKGDELVIPYEKYKLSNGLTLIVHEDHSDPVVHVDVTYHVGSAREEIGKSGFAHFFEHMMFQQMKSILRSFLKPEVPLTEPPTVTVPIILKPFQTISWQQHFGWRQTEWDFFLMQLPKKSLKYSAKL